MKKKNNNKSLEQLSSFYPDNLVIKIFKNKQELKKLEFEITEKENYDEYNKKVIVYLENNSPILINENIKQKKTFLLDGVNKKTGKYGSAKMVNENTINPKIYIYDWNKPEVMILGENYDEEFNDEYPEYHKMIETILTDLKRHTLELSKQ